MIKKIVLLCGLPGSGKSTWASKRCKSGNWNISINFDGCESEDDIDKRIEDGLRFCFSIHTVILDWLFLTNESRVKILNKVCTDKHVEGNPDIEIYEWRENREACLANDEGRRDTSSWITIKNAVWEPVDLDEIGNGLNHPYGKLTVDYFDVKVWSTKEKVLSEGDEDGKLYSDSWCGGGTWGNCWGGSGTVSAEPPVDFTQLDDLLSKYKPDITFLQYKRLMAECVETEESYEHDYYGGTTTSYRYVCDLKKLAEFLNF